MLSYFIDHEKEKIKNILEKNIIGDEELSQKIDEILNKDYFVSKGFYI